MLAQLADGLCTYTVGHGETSVDSRLSALPAKCISERNKEKTFCESPGDMHRLSLAEDYPDIRRVDAKSRTRATMKSISITRLKLAVREEDTALIERDNEKHLDYEIETTR